jgi:hypothetical protein
MHDDVTPSSKSRRQRSVLRPFKVATTLIIAPVFFAVIVVALVTVLFWITLGAGVWVVGVAVGIARPHGGRRLRSTGLRLLRSGPSRWLVRTAIHRAGRALNRLDRPRTV